MDSGGFKDCELILCHLHSECMCSYAEAARAEYDRKIALAPPTVSTVSHPVSHDRHLFLCEVDMRTSLEDVGSVFQSCLYALDMLKSAEKMVAKCVNAAAGFSAIPI